VNLLADNLTTINTNIDTFNYAIKEVGLEISLEKTKYEKVFENVSQYKYFGMAVTN
jgi:hypothetical protein